MRIRADGSLNGMRARCAASHVESRQSLVHAVPVTRHLASLLACCFLALAAIGVVLPGVPTVPFLLAATWFSARGSTRLYQWIYQHPQLGPPLIAWETEGAVPRRAKRLATIMLLASWALMYPRLAGTWLLVAITVLFCCVSAFLLTRPEPRRAVTDEPPSP